MTSRYILQLEQIIKEMNTADTDYLLWLNFLKQVHPQSELLKGQHQELSVDPNFGKDLKQFSDIREIMILAEAKRYPVWFIQPKFKEGLLLEYEQGELKKMDMNTERSVPKTIRGFTGTISGASCRNERDEPQFIANDVNRTMSFSQKMELLRNVGFTIAEFVLFPTNKIPTISSSKLEMFFQNYISKAQIQGLNVDGVVIISDTPLVTEDSRVHNSRIAYTPIQAISRH